MEKDKLIELSKQYFDNNKQLKEIYASIDGHFFYNESDASYHMAKTQTTLIKIIRDDLKPKKVVKEVTKTKK